MLLALKNIKNTGRYAAAVLAASLALILPVQEASAGLPVIDGSNLAENLTMRILSMQQWLEDNNTQINQLTNIKNNYSLNQDRFSLAKKNASMPNLTLWDDTKSVTERTLTLVSAAADLWSEAGSLSSYLSSFQKSSAWATCFSSGRCDFASYLKTLDNNAIATSRTAMQNADAMQSKMKQDADFIKSMMNKSQSSEGIGDTLDNLAKINAMTLNSIMDLNTQVNQLITLLGTKMARTSNDNLQKAERQEASYKDEVPYQQSFSFDLQAWKDGSL